MASNYERIAKKIGTPWSEEMEKILKILYTTEEALSMVKRYDRIPVENMMEAMMKTIEGRKN